MPKWWKPSKKVRSDKAGFTLIEILIVLVVIGILASMALNYFQSAAEKARLARVQTELNSISKAAVTYMIAEQDIPADVDRGLPNGMEEYLTNDDWPQGPWGESVYDWDNYSVSGNPVLQVSLRFCDISGSPCTFPDYEWAEDFNSNSSLYYCIYGPCQAHPTAPASTPGICVNCGNNDEF